MPSPISDSWNRIIAWVQANAPADCVCNFAPAATDDIAAAATKMGLVFPSDLIEWYQQVDGAESCGVFPSPDPSDPMAFAPMSLEEVVAVWTGQQQLVEAGQFDDCVPHSADGIAPDWWNAGWIPFATNGGGDLLCVDIAPAAAGRVGQMISHSHETGKHELLSPSLADYLHTLAAQLEQGLLVYDPTYGLVPPSAIAAEVEDQPGNDLFTGLSEWHYDNALKAGGEAFHAKDYALCVAHLERFEARLDKLAASRLAYARKKVAETR